MIAWMGCRSRSNLLPRASAYSRSAPSAIVSRHRLDAVIGGPTTVPRRQQSLREAIGWSHDLLDDTGAALFRRLAVFVGGWTLEAVAETCGTSPIRDIESTLEGLVDQNLVQLSAAVGDARFAMLETIGEFAHERLEASGEGPELRRRHREYFRGLCADAGALSSDPDARRAIRSGSRRTWTTSAPRSPGRSTMATRPMRSASLPTCVPSGSNGTTARRGLGRSSR